MNVLKLETLPQALKREDRPWLVLDLRDMRFYFADMKFENGESGETEII